MHRRLPLVAVLIAATLTATPAHATIPDQRFSVDLPADVPSLSTEYQQLKADFGGGLGKGTKFFDAGRGWAAAFQAFKASGWGHGTGERFPVLCSKRDDPAALNQLINDMAAYWGTWWGACWYQEPEDNIRDHTLTVSAYRQGWRDVAAVRGSNRNGRLMEFVPCMNYYVEDTQHARAVAGGYDAYHLLQGLTLSPGVFGADMYDLTNLGPAYAWPTRLDHANTTAKALGLPFALTEVGVQLTGPTDTQTKRAARVQQIIDYMNSGDPNLRWAAYWDEPPWRLEGTPAMRLWTNAMGH